MKTYLILIPFCALLSTFLWWLPDAFWKKYFDFFYKLKTKYLEFHSLTEAHELLRTLSRLDGQMMTRGSLGSFELPKYKFYTDLAQRVLDYARRFGSPLGHTIKEMKDALIKDIAYEKKLKKEFSSGLVQFLLVAAITWGFCFFSIYLLKLKIIFGVFLLMMGLQIAGTLLFIFWFYRLRLKYLARFPAIYSAFHSLLILSEAGLSVRVCLQESAIMELIHQKDRRFHFLFTYAHELIERWQQKGVPIKNELKGLLEQTKELEEEAWGNFLRFLAAAKFVVLCLGFLSAYFVYIFSLFNLFLIE